MLHTSMPTRKSCAFVLKRIGDTWLAKPTSSPRNCNMCTSSQANRCLTSEVVLGDSAQCSHRSGYPSSDSIARPGCCEKRDRPRQQPGWYAATRPHYRSWTDYSTALVALGVLYH